MASLPKAINNPNEAENIDSGNGENSPNQNKKNLSFVEIYQLIKKMNLDYNKNQTLEIIQELGIDKKQSIQIDNLIEKSKIRRSSSKYADFYDNILNIFITPSERILKILEEYPAQQLHLHAHLLPGPYRSHDLRS